MNRNFGFHWNEGGSSANGCSDTFHGGAAFSEVETQHVRDAVLAVAGPAEMYSDLPRLWSVLAHSLGLHCYSSQ
jgi:hypothetical protein